MKVIRVTSFLRRVILLALLFPLVVETIAEASTTRRPAGELHLKHPVTGSLTDGVVWVYTLHARAGDYLHLTLRSHRGPSGEVRLEGVKLSVEDVSGHLLKEVSGLTDVATFASLHCYTSGLYRVLVAVDIDPAYGPWPATLPKRMFDLELTALHSATGGDNQRITAEDSLFSAIALPAKPNDQVTEMLQTAARTWKLLGDTFETHIATTLLMDRLASLEKSAELSGAFAEVQRYISVELHIEQEFGFQVSETLKHRGEIQAEQGDREAAIQSLKESLAQLTNSSDVDFKRDVYRDLAANYLSLGRTDDVITVETAAAAIDDAMPTKTVGNLSSQLVAEEYDLGTIILACEKATHLLKDLKVILPYVTRLDRLKGAYHFNEAVFAMDEHDIETALTKYREASEEESSAGDTDAQAASLGSIGDIQSMRGELDDAFSSYAQAHQLAIDSNNISLQAVTLNGMARVDLTLGQFDTALNLVTQSVGLARKAQNRNAEASALLDEAQIDRRLGNLAAARQLSLQASQILRKTGLIKAEAIAEMTLGILYDLDVQPRLAAASYEQARTIFHQTGEIDAECVMLTKLAELYDRSPRTSAKALDYELSALHLSKQIQDPELDGALQSLLMIHFHANSTALAIHFGREAVDDFQQIRKNIARLDPAIQTNFAQSKSQTYRTLAELLVQENRLPEAEHILDLLKGAELKETIRGAADDPGAETAPLPLSAADRAAETSIASEASTAANLTAASFEYDRLNSLPNPDKVHLRALSAKITAGNAAIETFFDKTLYTELGGGANANARVSGADTETASFSNLLAGLGPGILALYTLVGEQHSYIIVTTANTRTRYEIKASAPDLRKLVLTVRQELLSPRSDPSRDLETLDHLLLDPIAADLVAAAKQAPDAIPTLLWSLDGVLRYIPVSALYDASQPEGRRYFVERARNVVITPESRDHLLEPPASASLKVAAFGLSRSYQGLAPLQGVTTELNSVVHDPSVADSHGPIDGKLMPNDAFTLAALEDNLRQQPPIVHIASHFVFQSSNAGENDASGSYLLLAGENTGGSGYKLTISKLQTDPQLKFRGVRLLTLSACSTAEADTASNGRDIDSLGMVVQKNGGASSVLATLWDVNDASTSQLMSDFYRRWATTPGIEKIEALRQAQIAMLHGASATPGQQRGFTVERIEADAIPTGFSHPYYWAPFVLIGNFR